MNSSDVDAWNVLRTHTTMVHNQWREIDLRQYARTSSCPKCNELERKLPPQPVRTKPLEPQGNEDFKYYAAVKSQNKIFLTEKQTARIPGDLYKQVSALLDKNNLAETWRVSVEEAPSFSPKEFGLRIKVETTNAFLPPAQTRQMIGGILSDVLPEVFREFPLKNPRFRIEPFEKNMARIVVGE